MLLEFSPGIQRTKACRSDIAGSAMRKKHVADVVICELACISPTAEMLCHTKQTCQNG